MMIRSLSHRIIGIAWNGKQNRFAQSSNILYYTVILYGSKTQVIVALSLNRLWTIIFQYNATRNEIPPMTGSNLTHTQVKISSTSEKMILTLLQTPPPEKKGSSNPCQDTNSGRATESSPSADLKYSLSQKIEHSQEQNILRRR